MKCEHGNTVKVTIEPRCRSGYWDDGIAEVDAEGEDWTPDPNGITDPPKFIAVVGCESCKTIEID